MDNYGYNTVTYVPKTRLQLAKEANDRALQDLVAASKALGKAQTAYKEAQRAEMAPCVCEPRTCNACGGKK